MIYMLEVFALLTGIVFAVVGIIVLILAVIRELREYARARQVMRRVAAQLPSVNDQI